MNSIRTLAWRWLFAAAALFSAAGQAAPLDLVPFGGEGNLVVFDAAAGSGGWVGAITQFNDPAAPVAEPLALVSVVLFSFDPVARTLKGTFEFTTTDLAGVLSGVVSGSFVDADVFTSGGQLSLDYQIQSASGRLAGTSGYGLSFLSFDPAGTGLNNYAEDGLLALAVPEPATLAMWGAGLLLLGAAGRRARWRAGPG